MPRNISEQHEWQKFSIEHVAWVLCTYRVNCVFDVGAHVGQFAASLRRAGYRGYIASFEPVPAYLEQLRQSAADDPAWLVYPFAIGQTEMTISMNVVRGTGSSVLSPSRYASDHWDEFARARTERVPMRRLDGLVDEVHAYLHEPVQAYLKLDTQGYDLEAFASAGERIRGFVGMQSEIAVLKLYEDMPHMTEAIAAYETAGFKISGMFPITREQDTGRVLEFDCVLVRATEGSDGAG